MSTDQEIWRSLPPRPWPKEVEPTPEQLADWFATLTRDQLVVVLDVTQKTWAMESRCFMENHEGRLQEYESKFRRYPEMLLEANSWGDRLAARVAQLERLLGESNRTL